MKNETKIFAAALEKAVSGRAEEEQKKIAGNFLEVLRRKQKIHLLPKILRELEFSAEERTVTLILAREAEGETVEKIKEKLGQKFGRDKKFKVEIDNSIMGGFKAKTNNFLIDSSIKTVIENLRQKLV